MSVGGSTARAVFMFLVGCYVLQLTEPLTSTRSSLFSRRLRHASLPILYALALAICQLRTSGLEWVLIFVTGCGPLVLGLYCSEMAAKQLFPIPSLDGPEQARWRTRYSLTMVIVALAAFKLGEHRLLPAHSCQRYAPFALCTAGVNVVDLPTTNVSIGEHPPWG